MAEERKVVLKKIEGVENRWGVFYNGKEEVTEGVGLFAEAPVAAFCMIAAQAHPEVVGAEFASKTIELDQRLYDTMGAPLENPDKVQIQEFVTMSNLLKRLEETERKIGRGWFLRKAGFREGMIPDPEAPGKFIWTPKMEHWPCLTMTLRAAITNSIVDLKYPPFKKNEHNKAEKAAFEKKTEKEVEEMDNETLFKWSTTAPDGKRVFTMLQTQLVSLAKSWKTPEDGWGLVSNPVGNTQVKYLMALLEMVFQNRFLTRAPDGRPMGQMFFNLTSEIEHGCLPNVKLAFTHLGVTWVALRPIKPGDRLRACREEAIYEYPREAIFDPAFDKTYKLLHSGRDCDCGHCFETLLYKHKSRRQMTKSINKSLRALDHLNFYATSALRKGFAAEAAADYYTHLVEGTHASRLRGAVHEMCPALRLRLGANMLKAFLQAGTELHNNNAASLRNQIEKARKFLVRSIEDVGELDEETRKPPDELDDVMFNARVALITTELWQMMVRQMEELYRIGQHEASVTPEERLSDEDVARHAAMFVEAYIAKVDLLANLYQERTKDMVEFLCLTQPLHRHFACLYPMLFDESFY